LSRVIDNTVLAQWVVPDKTPEIVNVIAGKLIAAQLHFNKIAETTGLIDQNSFSQKRYDEAMAMLNDIINGTIILPNIVTISTESITSADFFPIDAKDRAFTLSQPF
jgi:hypothetical protein